MTLGVLTGSTSTVLLSLGSAEKHLKLSRWVNNDLLLLTIIAAGAMIRCFNEIILFLYMADKSY